MKRISADPAWRLALPLVLGLRLFLALWAVLILTVSPLPEQPDEVLRPYLGEPPLNEGAEGALLGTWQRFDALHYLRIARQGYAAEEDSVFPPAYPLAMRLVGAPLAPWLGPARAHLLAGLFLSSLAFTGLAVLLFRVTAVEIDEAAARRAVVYLALFPSGFFLLAPYTESLFILLALGSFWAARRGRFWTAGFLGLAASLTRLTGWVLLVPLAYEYARRRQFDWRRIDRQALALALPPAGLLLFFAGRWAAGLPPLTQIYARYWYQRTAFPGLDLFTALKQMAAGEAAFILYIDFAIVFLLLGTTYLAHRRLGPAYSLYSLLLLLFMLLPHSELKPLFSFNRYALAFFPTFMVLGAAGKNGRLNRLIIYPSMVFYLYFSAQFFVWGWVG